MMQRTWQLWRVARRLLALLAASGGLGCAHHAAAPPAATHGTYEARLRQLERADSARNFSAGLRLTPVEKQADRRLVALREAMLAHYDSVHFFPPAHNFYGWRQHMYATRLYGLLRAMPKGGVHHLHPGAGGSAWWVVQRALREPNCYVFWDADRGPYLKGELRFFRPGEAPTGFYPAAVLGRQAQFPAQLHALLTFSAAMSRDSVDVWGKFEQCFRRLGGFTSYQPVFADMATATFDSLAADGVQHVELRAGLAGSLYDLRHPAGSFPADSIIAYYQQAARRVRATRQPAFTFQLIYADLRSKSTEQIQRSLRRAFALHRRYPGVVAAFDLVAHEDAGHPTRYFREVWRVRDSLAAATGVLLPLSLHDGESTWQHVPNVYDAAALGSRRIGHGFNLAFFPAAEELVRQQGICVEVSPLSNQLLGYAGDLRTHPAHTWVRRGVQISLSPDDPGIFDYVGVTPDYWVVFLAWELDLRDLKQLSLNGLEHSFLDAAQQQQARAAWQRDWDAFVARLNRELPPAR